MRFVTRPLVGTLLAIVALLLPAVTRAQGITGVVVDYATGMPLADVRIAVVDEHDERHAEVTSDSIGNFTVTLPPGTYTLQLERLGYAALTTQPLDLARAETVVLELRMGVRAIPLEPLTVTSRVPAPPMGNEVFYRRMRENRAIGKGRFMTRDQIEKMSTANVHSLLARDPAVRILRGRFNEYLAFRSRGRTCLPTLFLDGVRIENREETDLSAWIHPSQIEGVEIYPDQAFVPGELSSVDGCGALAIWSRQARGNPFTLKRMLIAGGIVGLMFLLTR